MHRGQRPAAAITIAIVALVIAGGSLHAQAGDAELQVNTFTPSAQLRPAVAADAIGGFVVMWTGYASGGTDTDGPSIQRRRFGSDALPLDVDDFQVNSYTTGYQLLSAIAQTANNTVMIVWMATDSPGNDPIGGAIVGRQFDAAGSALADDFQVNAIGAGYQQIPQVTGRSAGDFLVVWDSSASNGTDTDGLSVQLRRVDPSTGPAGTELQVNTYTTDWQIHAAVAAASDGSFVVAWQSGPSLSPYGDSIRARRFNSALSPLADDFLVNTNTAPRQADPDLAVAADGHVLVVWEAGDNLERDIRGRLYTAAGLAVGDDFVVNAYTTGIQVNPAVAADPAGGFVVVWQSDGSFGSDQASDSIQARRLTANGVPILPDFQVNVTESGDQDYADIAARSDGTFIVVWESATSSGSDSDQDSILGRVIHSFPLFGDGFERGDTTAWSGAVGVI